MAAAVMIITDRQSVALIRRQKRSDDPWSGQMIDDAPWNFAGKTGLSLNIHLK